MMEAINGKLKNGTFIPPAGNLDYLFPYPQRDKIQSLYSTFYFTRRGGQAVKKYEDLAKFPIVKTALDMFISGVFWPEHRIYARNDYKRFPQFESIDNQIISFLDYNLHEFNKPEINLPAEYRNDYTQTLEQILKACLRNAMIFGYTISKPIYKPFEGFTYLDDIRVMQPYNFVFEYETTKDKLRYIQQTTSGATLQLTDLITSPWPDFSYYNFAGISELLCLENELILLPELEKLRAQGINKVMIKPLIQWVSEQEVSDEEYQRAAVSVENTESGSVLIIPMKVYIDEKGQSYESKFQQFEAFPDLASQPAFQDIKNVIEQLEKRIYHVFGITDSFGNVNIPNGSNARAKTEFQNFTARLQSAMSWVSNFVNSQIIRPLIYYNFPNKLPKEYRYPQFRFGSIEEEFDKVEMEKDKMAIELGILNVQDINDLNYLREKYGYPIKVEGESTEAVKSENIFSAFNPFKKKNKKSS